MGRYFKETSFLRVDKKRYDENYARIFRKKSMVEKIIAWIKSWRRK